MQLSSLMMMMMMMMMMMLMMPMLVAVDLASPVARDRSYDEILVTEKLNAAAVLACFFLLSRRRQSCVSVGSTVST